MSLTSGRRSALSRWSDEDWEGPPRGLMIAGVLVLGLGLLALYRFGPELRRYIKIKSM